ncbi:DNA polymerase III subunit delta [uncultured Mailhella sp.]|uniref:DNA polymerase III subunit delta n=1 Tax=uncultured Mailhella sp. TaxID=1981031 RepID=UPI002607D2FF|nr:DNA polymerase III subunit delta [uncultured Mailhella sp.]
MERPGFFFSICPDAALLREALKRDILEPLASLSPDVAVFWGDEELDRRFWDRLTLQGLDSRLKVLVVRGAQQLPAETWKQLSSALATPRPGVLPVFCLEGPWEKGRPKLPASIAHLKCLAFADKKGWVWRSAGLDARSLRSYLQRQARDMGFSLTPDALNMLAEILIPDASAVHGALEQLFLAAENGTADAALVRQTTEFTPEAVIFDVIRQIERGQSAEVWKTLLREGDGGESLLFPLLALLAREGRMLWQMLAKERVYCPQYVEAEKRRIAAALGFSGLVRLFAALERAECSVKTGSVQPVQAVEILTAELSLLFRRR